MEDTIIKIIEKTDHIQRQQIRMSFYKNYFKNLILIIKKELSGNFKESVLGSFLLPSEYDTYSLYSSFKNANQKKELILSEIIGSRSTSELQTIKKLYISNYRKLLRKDVISQTYGEFQKFILSLLQCQRSTASIPNTNSCANDASDLYQDIAFTESHPSICKFNISHRRIHFTSLVNPKSSYHRIMNATHVQY